MKKKVWIRVLGVVALLAWVWDCLVWHSAITTRPGLDRGYMGWVAIFFAAVAGLLTAVWALFSIIDWAMRRSAKLQAVNLAQQFSRTPAAAGPPVHFPAPAAVAQPGVANCAQCGQPAPQWWCYQHASQFCDACAGQHRMSFPACQWAQRQPAAPQPALRPREVKTSALAGIR